MTMSKRLLPMVLIGFMVLLAGCRPNPGDASTDTDPVSREEDSSTSPSSAAEAALQDDLIPIVSQETRSDRYPIEWLELDGTILIYRRTSVVEDTVDGNIEAIDAASGLSLYHRDLDPAWGELLRIAPCDTQPGYDYALFFERMVMYKNSRDWSETRTYELPESVQPLRYRLDAFDTAGYDINTSHIVWAAEEGIWLSDRNGDGARLLLSNEHVSSDYKAWYGEDTGYIQPRFISGDTAVVAGIGTFSPDGHSVLFPIVYDLASFRQIAAIEAMLPHRVRYPVNDRYVVVSESRGLRILDVTDGTETDCLFDHNISIWSPDGEAIIWHEIDMDHYHSHPVKVYLATVDTPFDTSTVLLDADSGWMVAVGEHHFVYTVDAQLLWLKKYR